MVPRCVYERNILLHRIGLCRGVLYPRCSAKDAARILMSMLLSYWKLIGIFVFHATCYLK